MIKMTMGVNGKTHTTREKKWTNFILKTKQSKNYRRSQHESAQICIDEP